MKPDQSGATWLELARRQSQLAANARAEQNAPFDWDAVDMAPHARAARYRWLLILLPAVLAVGTTATWAFVRHLKQRKPAGAKSLSTWSATPAKQRAPQRVRLKKRISPAAQPQQRPKRIPVPQPKRLAKPVVSDQPVSKAPAHVTADDEVIIVVPPAKMKPLWNVESLRR
jgi:hypothetical protein